LTRHTYRINAKYGDLNVHS